MIDFKTITKKDLNQIDLKELKKYINTTWYSWSKEDLLSLFDKPAGREHYKLLAHISTQLPKKTLIYDLGTYMGLSALALAYNPDVRVVTLDIVDIFPDDQFTIKNKDNIIFQKKNCLSVRKGFFQNNSIILLDVDPHDGIQEVEFYKLLKKINWKGILLCDDIFLNQGMTSFWEQITERKVDLTLLGHYTGTGAVFFE